MRIPFRLIRVLAPLIAAAGFVCSAHGAAGNALEHDAAAALQLLYASTPTAKAVGAKAKAILVFPSIVKAGGTPGAQSGDGVLIKNGKTAGFYNTAGLSVRLPAKAQTFAYVLFFMDDAALNALDNATGWELGTGPTMIIVDSGLAKTFTTMPSQFDIYAFVFDRIGLLARADLRGGRVTRFGRPPS